MRIRATENGDAETVARLLLEADDTRVVSAEGIRHMRRNVPERARMVELVAEVDGAVVGSGAAGLDTSTSTEGAGWAFVTVDPACRGRGIGDALGRRLLDHLRKIDSTNATSFFRSSEEGERWASARGWSKVLGGPLIAVDPRGVPEPSPPAGYRCVSMSEVAAETVFETVREAALDEPTPVPHDDYRLDDFLR